MTLPTHARRTWLVATFALLLASFPAQAQDFGSLLKKTATDVLRKQTTPENISRLAAPLKQGEIFTVKTADGWTLVASRFKPKVAPKPGAAPIILCHGLSYSALFWSLDPSCNMPEYLAGLGYDVWVVNLRGCGLSQKWVWKLDDAPSMVVGGALRKMSNGKIAPTGYATIDPKYANWTLDDHITYDVPALVSLVKHHTRSPEVTWVGHSMGGIVAIGHLSRYVNPGIGKLVTVGSQITMPEGQLFLQFASEMLNLREGQITGEIVGKELVNQSRTSVDNLFFNERNAPPKVYEALSTWAKDVPSIGLMRQYMDMAKTGVLVDSRRQFNYANSVANVKVPILVTCGAADQLAPPPVQKILYDRVGSTDKTLLIFGRARGFAVDSGHNDTLVGNTSRAQIYPVIERWIAGAR